MRLKTVSAETFWFDLVLDMLPQILNIIKTDFMVAYRNQALFNIYQ